MCNKPLHIFLPQISSLRGILPYLTIRDVLANRVSFHGKNYVTGCPFLIQIMQHAKIMVLRLIRKLYDRLWIMWKDIFQNSLEMDNVYFWQNFNVAFWGYFACNRVQGVERFATYPPHFPSQVPLGLAPVRGI